MAVCALCGQETSPNMGTKFKNAMSTYVNPAETRKGKELSVFNDDAEKIELDGVTWIRQDLYKPEPVKAPEPPPAPVKPPETKK